MKNVEDLLQRMALNAPSEEFQTRMDSVFQEAAARAPSWRNRPVPLWKCALVCGLCVALAFVLGLAIALPHVLFAPRNTVVYMIQHQSPEERNAFDIIQKETVQPPASNEWTVWQGEILPVRANDASS